MNAKVAVVTGGASGIGRATCSTFLARGWNVVSADISHPDGKYTGQPGSPSRLDIRTDVTDDTAVRNLVESTRSAFGRVDAVVTSAGTALNNPVRRTTPDDFRRTLDVNLVSTFRVARAFVDLLAADGGGAVVTIASVSGLRGSPERASYSASKGGVIALTTQLAFELAQEGIRVNCVAPGSTQTPLARQAQNPAAQRAILQAIPLRRYAEPSEIAEVIVFLAGPASSFVTGQTWTADGGQSSGAGWSLPEDSHAR
ncbi:MAG: SDR family oxidoreductase [Rhodococcus sp. (in: high G+C Gram-positive bacteria)]